jgi:hypothetical protein
MVVILNGPLGVGKTETAWKLLQHFERGAVLDCDYIGGNVSFFDPSSEASFTATLDSLLAFARYQRDRLEITDFIVSGVFETEEQRTGAEELFREISTPVVCFALMASPFAMRNRVLQRGNNVARELQRAYELLSIFEDSENLGEKIDTTALSIDETVAMLLKRIKP